MLSELDRENAAEGLDSIDFDNLEVLATAGKI
jgi:hypothetical protein